jgi:plastocyanin
MNSQRSAGVCLTVFLGLMGATSSAGPSVAQRIAIEGVKFTPDVITVKRGEWVQWVNKDPFPHTVTSLGAFDSHSIPSGKTWKYRAREAGEFQYMCTLHPNMKAVLRVEQ